jgi:hypothetical protein
MKIVATAIALLACAPLLAAPALDDKAIATATQLREQAMAGSEAFSIVESLTTEVGPRMAGSPAYDRATAWAQEKFRALGYDRVYLEPTTFPVWQRGHESAQVLAPFPQPLQITTLGGSVGTEGKPLQAEVVEFASLDALKASPAHGLTGKIAYISLRMERFRDGRGYGPAVSARGSGASEAAKKGAVALLIRSIGTDSDRLPHTGTMRYEAGVEKIPAAALSNPDADLLSAMLRRGQPVRLQMDISAGFTGLKTEYNVIGEIRGRGKPDEVVVIGGHLDSWDLGTGAIDDGAGVAITMAAGAMIGRLEQAPLRTIRVIAWANEEQGLYGAKAYAEAHGKGKELARHQIGAESDFGAGRIYALRGRVAAEAEPVLARIAEVLAPLGIAYEPGAGGPGPDIGPMARLGMPWAQLAQDGTDYFDYHHTANDTLDKIDPKALDQQVAAYAVLAWLEAESKVDFGTLPTTNP